MSRLQFAPLRQTLRPASVLAAVISLLAVPVTAQERGPQPPIGDRYFSRTAVAAPAPTPSRVQPIGPAMPVAAALASSPPAASAKAQSPQGAQMAPVPDREQLAKPRHSRARFHRARLRREPINPVQSANAQARAYASPDAYLNSTLVQDYEPGKLYQIETSPHFLTAILLRPGEKLVSKAAGDTVRWVMGETLEGSGATQRVMVLIKPIHGGLRTNIVLTTDQRSYLIEASSHEGGTYSSALSWNYPQDQMQAVIAARPQASESSVASGLSLEQLHFGYRIDALRDKPHWQPVRVFDDGTRTYIQFPPNMASTEAPPLFLVGSGGKAELVNYRLTGGYYVVDRLIDVAELRLGERVQTVVRITRTRDRG